MAISDLVKLYKSKKTPGEDFTWTPAMAARARKNIIARETDSPAGPDAYLADYKPVDTSLVGVIPQRGLTAPEVAVPAAAAMARKTLTAPAASVEPKPDQGAGKPPSAAGKADWKGRLSKGLAAAAYAMQANVGRPIAGQPWRQGILRGIAGIGAHLSSEEARKAAGEAADKSMADKLKLIQEEARLRKEEKAGEPTWAEKFEKTEAGKMARLEKSQGAISDRVKSARQQSISSAGTEQQAKDWKDAWDDAIKEVGPYGMYGTDADARLSVISQRNFDNTQKARRGEMKPPKKVIPTLPD